MTTRIKEVIDSNGRSVYYPQFKLMGLFWVDYEGHCGSVQFNKIENCIEWLEYKPNVKTFYHRMK